MRILLLVLLLLPALAVGEPTPPTNLQVLSSAARQLPQESNGTIAAQGGNVTNVNIDALTITKSWQGYYGNITGSIHLDDANNQSFYIWGNASPSGEVFASRNGTIQWTTVNCTNGTQRAAEESFLGQSAGDGDSVTNTFNGTSHPQFLVGSQTILTNTCFSTNAFVNGASQSSSFHQILLSDDGSNTVYTTIIEDDTQGYNGLDTDFQLLVGENEHQGNEGPTTYYFWTELS